jgi:hypothetical protein
VDVFVGDLLPLGLQEYRIHAEQIVRVRRGLGVRGRQDRIRSAKESR